ncbi:hypothetical protein F5Y19DRAFT_466404 [Xylariaceae sp. FL1651]|nr:hypothetical protein F5Y19DRAFT_466404 [Xylariaceae sp. FL1651]
MGGLFSKPIRPPASETLREAGLQVLLPSDTEYEVRQDSYWSNSAKLKPSCIVQPRDAQEVATAVKMLAAAGEQFAIRSGGHTQWAGSNNIENGVTIDLGLLAWTRFDAGTETVDIGPGGRWRDVYAELAKHDRVVAGGREGNVGVAGLILGGGNTFYTARHGFACDNVVAFEVVLADGRVVTANAEDVHTKDLFWALKGGSSNFGVVTNFRMRALKSSLIWGGVTVFPRQVTPAATEALVAFTDDMHKDLDSNLLCFFAYTGAPQFKDIGIATLYVQTTGIERPPAYDKWLSLPSIASTCQVTTVLDLVSAPQNNMPMHYHDIWFTATFKNDVRIVAKATELHEAMVAEFKAFISDGDFWTQCLFQPLPKIFGERSAAAGGNAMGIENQSVNGLLFQAVAMVRTPEQEEFAYPKVKAWAKAVNEFAVTMDCNLEWTYLNYSDKSQDPLGTYGTNNVKKLKSIAAKYDPNQVFQKLCLGGFKISEVKN